MNYQGYSQIATYMTGPRPPYNESKLPNIGAFSPCYTKNINSEFSHGVPSQLKRSLTTLPWNAATFYKSSNINPSIALLNSQTAPLCGKTALGELEGLKVPPVFSAARNALYTRYTPKDWMTAAMKTFQSADRVRNYGERIRFDTNRLGRETDDQTKRAQEDVGKKIGDKLSDTNFWKTELDDEIDKMITENNNLNEMKRVAEKMFGETENQLHIGEECLYTREKRQGIDLVHDNVEKSLIGEIDTVKKAQDDIRTVINKANAQMSLNRAAQHENELDSRDKFIAQQIDENAHQIKNSSAGINFHNGVETIDNCISTPETWAKFTDDNVKRCQAERENSTKVREEIEATLDKCANDMWKRWNNVNTALTERIQETIDARNKIQGHLAKILQEIFDMEKNIEYLKKCIKDKEDYMKVAQTRLHFRLRRPGMELCRDQPNHRLVEEIDELREVVAMLMRELREAETALQHLLDNKAVLEQDLNIKNNTLFIDREKCLGLRKTFPIQPRLAFG